MALVRNDLHMFVEKVENQIPLNDHDGIGNLINLILRFGLKLSSLSGLKTH